MDETKAWKLLRAWGYDEDLYPVQGRSFLITTHSMNLLQMSIDEADLLKDYEDMVSVKILQKYGK
eukprot:CAMPEP_0176343090 /NCGR_PEP_ID=MMETSP0126-20121128/3678_1 /TAXON_ID=141414 ORGANISM="Strombidinopsis acuminatum, Strain SPMC142" /NCGR_SAMPLE_ID=MMETSP0126 /ASSEMBLY_ACC=CAM_ASM_000229 /LENGTH=64 /DNA_ID=CAMNT_0017688855 /DNA_START=1204 /DNA_END=1398 /DNA_ORIENTATION=-